MILPKARRERREVIAGYCKRLSWSPAAGELCAEAPPIQEIFWEYVMAAELAHREVGRRARLLSRAGFPAHKTLADFDRRVAQLPSALSWTDLEQGTFIADPRNLILFGDVGRGNYAKSPYVKLHIRGKPIWQLRWGWPPANGGRRSGSLPSRGWSCGSPKPHDKAR